MDPALRGRTAVITGGTGALGSAIALGLAAGGARVAILARTQSACDTLADQVRMGGGEAIGVATDVLDREALVRALDTVLKRFESVDVLVNAAGGNLPAATVPPDGTIFDLEIDALREVIDLNLIGTLLPIQVFGKAMAAAGSGSIVNVSSMAAGRSLSRVAGYGAAKSAVENLTRWLAVHLAEKYGDKLRVNAIAPGFLIGSQNRSLLLEPDGRLTTRGTAILQHTPMRRFGTSDDVVGPVLWLASDWSRFVTGVVVAVDGGFSASSGV